MTDRSTPDDENEGRTDTSDCEITYEIGKDETPSVAVVVATATLTNRSVIDLDPLFDVIDPDHLDGLFADFGTRAGHAERSVTFTFNGCHVSVTEHRIVVRATDDVAD